jgi:serine/threonine protein kinase
VSDIIHGDIKPENVLLFKDECGALVPKLADFGYSTMSLSDMPIYLPKSKPWTAPEHHHRGFNMLSARRMDVYSFGMLCLWLLFRDQFSNKTSFLLWPCAMDGVCIIVLMMSSSRSTSRISRSVCVLRTDHNNFGKCKGLTSAA